MSLNAPLLAGQYPKDIWTRVFSFLPLTILTGPSRLVCRQFNQVSREVMDARICSWLEDILATCESRATNFSDLNQGVDCTKIGEALRGIHITLINPATRKQWQETVFSIEAALAHLSPIEMVASEFCTMRFPEMEIQRLRGIGQTVSRLLDARQFVSAIPIRHRILSNDAEGIKERMTECATEDIRKTFNALYSLGHRESAVGYLHSFKVIPLRRAIPFSIFLLPAISCLSRNDVPSAVQLASWDGNPHPDQIKCEVLNHFFITKAERVRCIAEEKIDHLIEFAVSLSNKHWRGKHLLHCVGVLLKQRKFTQALDTVLRIDPKKIEDVFFTVFTKSDLFWDTAYEFSCALPNVDLRDRCLRICVMTTSVDIFNPKQWECMEKISNSQIQKEAIQIYATGLDFYLRKGDIRLSDFERVKSTVLGLVFDLLCIQPNENTPENKAAKTRPAISEPLPLTSIKRPRTSESMLT